MCETIYRPGLLLPEQQFKSFIFSLLLGDDKILVNLCRENSETIQLKLKLTQSLEIRQVPLRTKVMTGPVGESEMVEDKYGPSLWFPWQVIMKP